MYQFIAFFNIFILKTSLSLRENTINLLFSHRFAKNICHKAKNTCNCKQFAFSIIINDGKNEYHIFVGCIFLIDSLPSKVKTYICGVDPFAEMSSIINPFLTNSLNDILRLFGKGLFASEYKPLRVAEENDEIPFRFSLK